MPDKNGLLTRVAHGIYCYPRIDERWGGGGILFKHTSEMRTFAYKSNLMALIVTALREIAQ